MKRNVWLAVVAAVALAGVWAAPHRAAAVSRLVEAEGENLQTAIINALEEAVRQVNGTEINSDRAMKYKYESAIHDLRTLSAGFDEYMEHKIETAAKGIVNSYTVIEKRRNPDTGRWTVRMDVDVPKYDPKTWRWGERWTIAVIPFRDRSDLGPRAGERMVSSSAFLRQFNQQLVVQLTHSRKFTVLEREFLEELKNELDLINSDKTPLAEKVKAGQMLGADFLVVGSLESLDIQHMPFTVELTGYQGERRSAVVKLDYRVINAGTGKVEWAGSAGAVLNDEDIARLPGGGSDERILEVLSGDMGYRIAGEILDVIYPVKVVKVQSNGEVILNQGGLRLTPGEQFTVYVQGEKLIDPDTGESLGREETRVAQIEVVRIEPKLSYARVIEGRADDIRTGAVCRHGAFVQPPPGAPQDSPSHPPDDSASHPSPKSQGPGRESDSSHN
ncbi:MAG: hypothetical protein Kow0059_15610 [Candidatus Sumerlaeia bacterium]